MIEENRDTFNWYVNEIQFKDKYDIDVSIKTEYENDVVSPKFLKTFTHYKIRPVRHENSGRIQNPLVAIPQFMKYEPVGLFGSNKINHSWCSFVTSIKNTGSMVIEDWKFWLEFSRDAREIDDDFTKDIFSYKEHAKYRTTWAYEEDNEIIYRPLNNAPLIQKDSKSFKSFFIPEYESTELTVRWRLLARDFDREGELKFKIEPQYEIEEKIVFVDESSEIKTREEIGDYITLKKQSGSLGGH